MSAKALQITTIVLFGALTALAGQDAPLSSTLPPAPPSPHWYQCVAHGVTVTNLTPVAYFRGLLGMTPAERNRVLADQPAAERRQVLAKVTEYTSLPPVVREERLRQTELHWYLLTLLRLSPAEREKRMKEISPLYQPMLMSSLSQWDEMPADLRQALLEKESFLRVYVQWQGHPASAQAEVLGRLSAEQQARWTEELGRWQRLQARQRDELSETFRRFFYLTTEQRNVTVQALSEGERRQMEQALRSYASLPPALQRKCVESFSKFAEMSADEREQFLQNAAKWEKMTASERQLWRTLVNMLPPMPPGFYQPSLPPMPPDWHGPPLPMQTMAGGAGVTSLAQAPTTGEGKAPSSKLQAPEKLQ